MGRQTLGAEAPTRTVEELCELVVDCPHSTPKWTAEGVVVLRSRNIRRGRLNLAAQRSFTTEDNYRKRVKRAVPQGGDIVITREAPMGEVCILPDGLKCCMGQRMVLLRPNPRLVVGRFLLFALQSRSVQHQIGMHEGTGSTVSNLRIPALKALKLPWFALEEQRRIAAVLGALDDKIELNRKMNRTLEAMAQAIFKSWFIDFDGVSPRPVQTLIDDGLLVVSDGYRAKRIELSSAGLPFARAGNIKNGFHFDGAEILGFDGVKRAKHKVSKPGDVVFTSKGTVGRFAFVAPTTRKFAYSPQLCFWRSLDASAVSPYFLLRWMRSHHFLHQVAAVKGQTDMADYVSLRDQRRMLITIPPATAQAELVDRLRPLGRRVALCVAESRTLAALRDTLLPKLISGEIRVPEAQATIAAAV